MSSGAHPDPVAQVSHLVARDLGDHGGRRPGISGPARERVARLRHHDSNPARRPCNGLAGDGEDVERLLTN
jgi:hypothetical protein